MAFMQCANACKLVMFHTYIITYHSSYVGTYWGQPAIWQPELRALLVFVELWPSMDSLAYNKEQHSNSSRKGHREDQFSCAPIAGLVLWSDLSLVEQSTACESVQSA